MLLECPICGLTPRSYAISRYIQGYVLRCWVVECDGKELDYVLATEHNISVYGLTQEEAEQKWKELCK